MEDNIMTKKISQFFISTLLFSALFITAVKAAPYINLNLTYDGTAHKYNAEKVYLKINGNDVSNLPMEPVILNSTTLVPAKEVFESLGAVVDWKNDTKEVYIGYNDNIVVLKIDDKKANVNGNSVEMLVAPKIINNKTMIPAKFAAESIHCTVNWDAKNRIVSIASPDDNSDVKPVDTDLPVLQDDINQPTVTTPIVTTPVITTPVDTTTPTVDNTTFQGDNKISKDVSQNQIKPEVNPLTDIVSVEIPTIGGSNAYKINASSKITSVSKLLLPDNRLVIDIVNSNMALPKSNIEIPQSPFVSAIRAAQNQVEPTKVTRIVFDLKAYSEFSVDLSPDRKTISVEFKKNVITSIGFGIKDGREGILISGLIAPNVSISYLTNPDRMVMDVPYAELQNPSVANLINTAGVDSNYFSASRVAQFDASTVRIALDLKKQTFAKVTSTNTTTTVLFIDPTYKNLRYDSASKQLIITKDNSQLIGAKNIAETDLYLEKKYNFTLPFNASNILGYGDIAVGDNYIDTISIQNYQNNTIITVNEKSILAFNITEDNNYIYIKALLPKEKYGKIVVIDPGHGAKDNGTQHNGLLEKDVNLDIALKLYSQLQNDGSVKVYATRLTDVKPELDERAAFANGVGDVFISIHQNSNDNEKINGTEVYFYKHPTDVEPYLTSKKVATAVQANLIATLASNDRKVKEQTLKESYAVLRNTTIPAVLIEVGFVSNKEEAAKLAADDYRQKTADAIYRSIIEIFTKNTIKR